MLTLRGGCRPLQPTRPTPSWHRRQAVAPAGFGLLPVRSPLLRESSLFLGVLRCFSSPGALLSYLRCPAVRRAGCPIRTSPDRRLPAPPRGISPRGRVLPRPPTPRHPPCAHHADILRTSPSRMRVTAPADRHAPAGWSRLAAPPAPSVRRPPGDALCLCVFVFVYVAVQCARASRHEPLPPHRCRCAVRLGSGEAVPGSVPRNHRPLPRPQNPTGSAWRLVKVHDP